MDGLGTFRRVVAQISPNRALSRLLIAYFAVILAEYGQWIALLVYAYERGGASAAGLVAVLQLVTSGMLAPLISAHGVRFGAARLLVASYLASTLLLACSAATILLGAPTIAVYASAIAFSVALGVSRPLHNVLMPLVVRQPDELTSANVATSWCDGLGTLAGPAIAGLLIGVDGPGLACAGLAAICLAAPLLARVQPLRAAAELEGSEEAGGWADLRLAARVIASRPNTRALLAYPVGAAAIEGAVDLLVVLLAVKILMIGPGGAGFLSAAFGAGGLVGGAASVLLVDRPLALPLAAAALAGGLALAALALASTVGVAVVLLLVVGASRTVQSVAAQTLLQRSTPLDVIVCAFALIESLRDAGLAFGALLVPVFVSLGGAKAAFLGTALFAPLAVLVTARRIRRIDGDADIPVVEMGLLRNLSIFAALPPAPLETLAREAVHRHVPTNTVIIREGEDGDRFYAIADGAVLVTQNGREVRRMGRGEGFGEIALLYAVRRSATVTATQNTSLLSLERDAFLTALHASSAVGLAAGRIAAGLIGESAEVLGSS
jgi:Cyclic nucleotide-binding domain/Major Facilitator Superfamily